MDHRLHPRPGQGGETAGNRRLHQRRAPAALPIARRGGPVDLRALLFRLHPGIAVAIPLEDLKLVADPEKNFLVIMKDGIIRKNTLSR